MLHRERYLTLLCLAADYAFVYLLIGTHQVRVGHRPPAFLHVLRSSSVGNEAAGVPRW